MKQLIVSFRCVQTEQIFMVNFKLIHIEILKKCLVSTLKSEILFYKRTNWKKSTRIGSFLPNYIEGWICSPYLKILKHCAVFQDVFPHERILPKHHGLETLSNANMAVGPLIVSWTMLFKSKQFLPDSTSSYTLLLKWSVFSSSSHQFPITQNLHTCEAWRWLMFQPFLLVFYMRTLLCQLNRNFHIWIMWKSLLKIYPTLVTTTGLEWFWFMGRLLVFPSFVTLSKWLYLKRFSFSLWNYRMPGAWNIITRMTWF